MQIRRNPDGDRPRHGEEPRLSAPVRRRRDARGLRRRHPHMHRLAHIHLPAPAVRQRRRLQSARLQLHQQQLQPHQVSLSCLPCFFFMEDRGGM